MNAPSILDQRPPTTDLSPELRTHFLELLADLGLCEFELLHNQGARVAAEGSRANLSGEGYHTWSVNDTEQIELSPAEADALLPFVDERGTRPLTLAKASGTERVDVLRNGAWASLGVQVTEHVTVKVLRLTIAEDTHEARIQIEGAGEYSA